MWSYFLQASVGRDEKYGIISVGVSLYIACHLLSCCQDCFLHVSFQKFNCDIPCYEYFWLIPVLAQIPDSEVYYVICRAWNFKKMLHFTICFSVLDSSFWSLEKYRYWFCCYLSQSLLRNIYLIFFSPYSFCCSVWFVSWSV